MNRKMLIGFGLLLCFVSQLSAQELKETNPHLYVTANDILRAKKQMTNPELRPSLEALKLTVEKNIRNWKKTIPAKSTPYSLEELFELSKEPKIQPDYVPLAAAMVYFPSDETAKTLREMILYEIGIHKNEGSWWELGIHESDRLHRFLYSYDLMAETGLFSSKEKEAIKNEMHQSGRFLESWCLESPLNTVYQGQTYCFNIKYSPITMLGTIAMYFPDFEESAAWLEKAQDEVPRYFFTENFLDGAYGEGSMNYWSSTGDAITYFIIASRNLNVKDYTLDLPLRKAYQNYLYWRINLTAPDGRKSAIGDSHHENAGNNLLEWGAMLLNDPEMLWCARNNTKLASKDAIWQPKELLSLDLSLALKKPVSTYANYIWSGYGVYRSGWNADANYFMMKYGPTFAGRREVEKYPVIAGHAHEDCMNIEMFYKGIPMFIDGGNRGVYQDYDTYGGYIKATIAHNTVGLGNEWGYSRTDGKFSEHQKEHGKEFRYEKEQINIGRQTYRMKAWGDVDDCVLLSAKAQTYDDVEHQRTVLWFRNSSLMIVHDKLKSDNTHYFEWYLNPVGKNLSKDGKYTFGDEKANLDVIQVGNKPTSVIGKGTSGIPRYYINFRDDSKPESGWDGDNARWFNYSLLTETSKAKETDFFNVLVPYDKINPYAVSDFGKNGKCLISSKEKLLISLKSNEKELSVNGWFGMLKKEKEITDYALSNGYELSENGDLLLKSELFSLPWAKLYDHAVSALVSLSSRRASFILNPDPWNESLLMYNPKIEEGKEPPVPIRVKISFKVNEKPNRIVKLRSNEKQAELNDPVFTDKIKKGNFFTGKKQYGLIESRIAREELKFDYDAKTKIVSIILPNGFNQIVWE